MSLAFPSVKSLIEVEDCTYVVISEIRACFITSPSDITIPSVPTNVTVACVVAEPSIIFSSVALDVTPSRMFSSSGVEVIAVALAAARTGKVPD